MKRKLDTNGQKDDDSYFEFQIQVDELEDVSLIITFC